MGCTQTSASVIPYNHVPIERLYNNEGYSTMKPSPVVMITASPIPSYLKSALKKPGRDGKGRKEGFSILKRKPPQLNRQVNFNEQVLVKPRSPTPSKIWYEKASSTMPMRRHPRNDDDDDDYDKEEITSISSDEEQVNDQQVDTQSPIPINKPNNLWYKHNFRGLLPLTNKMLENESFPLAMQQSPFNVNTYATSNPTASSANCIKVRRKLSHLDPPQISFATSYQPPLQSSAALLYQSSTQPSTIPAYQIPAQTPIVPLHQSPTVPPFQTPIVSSYQSPVQTSTNISSKTNFTTNQW
jgi:hypothetical protein